MNSNQNDHDKREYYLDMLDPDRNNTKLATMDMSNLTAYFEKNASILTDVSTDKYMNLYKTNSTKKKEDDLNLKKYQMEQKEIELSKFQIKLLSERDRLERWESDLQKRENRLKSSNVNQFNFHPTNELRGIQNDIRPPHIPYSNNLVRPPIPSYTEKLIDDSNYHQNFNHQMEKSDYSPPQNQYPTNTNIPDDYDEEEEYQNALKNSLEDGLKFLDDPKTEEIKSHVDEPLIEPPISEPVVIKKSVSKYSFMKTKPDDVPDNVIDTIYDFLKKEDYKGARKYMTNENVSTKTVQWLLSLEYEGSKFKQLIANTDSSICKLFENPN